MSLNELPPSWRSKQEHKNLVGGEIGSLWDAAGPVQEMRWCEQNPPEGEYIIAYMLVGLLGWLSPPRQQVQLSVSSKGRSRLTPRPFWEIFVVCSFEWDNEEGEYSRGTSPGFAIFLVPCFLKAFRLRSFLGKQVWEKQVIVRMPRQKIAKYNDVGHRSNTYEISREEETHAKIQESFSCLERLQTSFCSVGCFFWNV